MYYTRAVASRRIRCVRAWLVAMALGTVPLSAGQLPAELDASAGAADRAACFISTTETLARPSAPAINLTILSKSSTADRSAALAESTKRTVTLLDAWLGPLRRERLTLIDAPWNSRLSETDQSGVMVVRSRWLTTLRDRAVERELIAGLARQYWLEAGVDAAFADAASIYTAARAIDAQLQGSQFHTDRFIGGFLPYSLRPLELSPAPRDMRPRLRRYEEASWNGADAARLARVIETAERELGWASLQAALRAARSTPRATIGDFARLLSEQRGHDVSGLFEGAVGQRFDYAVSALDSTANANRFDVRVTVERRGEAIFNRPLTLETRFADGTFMRERWDASQQRSSVEYSSPAPAVSAAIDPDVILLLDEARANNALRLERLPASELAIRLACGWAIWLQNVMLAYSGLV